MKLLRHYPLLAFLLVMVSIMGVSLTQHSVAMALVAGALAVMSWFVTEGPRGRTLPAWVSNILVVAVSLNVIVDVVQNPGDLLGVLARFSVWLTIIKLYERRNARDHAQLLMLSLLMMLTGCMNSADLLFGVVVVIYIVLGLYVLLLHQVYSAYEMNRNDQLTRSEHDSRVVPTIRPIMGRRMPLHFRSLSFFSIVLGLMISTIVFVGFPRGFGKSSLISFPQLGQRQESGFSDRIDLTSGTSITESRKPVMRVRLVNSRGEAFRAPDVLRLRGAVLDRYRDGGRWAPATMAPIGIPVQTAPQTLAPIHRGGRGVAAAAEELLVNPDAYTIEVEPLVRVDRLFAVQYPIGVTTEQPTKVTYDPATQMLRLEEPLGRVGYRVRVLPEPEYDDLLQFTTPPRGAQLQQPLLSNDNIQELADRLLRANGLPLRARQGRPIRAPSQYEWADSVARVFTDFLQSDAFQYTLDLSDVTLQSGSDLSVDPIEQFLLTTRRGHCEYFASALAAMCYNVGVEARVVTGYAATLFDELDMQYTIIEANAHAWVEVRTGQRSWTTFDPTPPAVLDALSTNPDDIGLQLRSIYDEFDGTWSRQVVDFDESAQARLRESLDMGLMRTLNGWMASFREWFVSLDQRLHLGAAAYIWLVSISLPALVGLIALFTFIRRRLRLRRALDIESVSRRDAHRMLRQLGFYLDMLEVLRRSGEPRPDWYPPMAFAQAVEQRRPEVGDTVTKITDLFYRGRYGQESLDREEIRSARELISQLATDLKVRWRG